MRRALLALLLPALCFAQAVPRPAQFNYATTAPLSLFVDSAGYDGNDCKSIGSACLTLQGAINKVPKRVRHAVEITVSTGTYAGASIEGFSFDRSGNATGSAWIHLNGTLVTATAASGAPGGTVTSGTIGAFSDGTLNTLTVSGAGWTSDDFKGKLVWFTSGSNNGKLFTIASNTSTVISFAGFVSPAPANGDGFLVLDWGTTISGTVPQWSSPSGVFGAYFANIISLVIQDSGRAENVSINKLKFSTAPTGSVTGVLVNGATASFTYNRFEGTTGGARIYVSNGSKVLAQANSFSLNSSARAFYALDESTLDPAVETMFSVVHGKGNVFLGQSLGFGRGYMLDNGAVVSNYDYFNNLDRCFNLGRAEVYVFKDVMVGGSLGVNYSLADDLPTSGQAQIDGSWIANMSNAAVAMNGAGRVAVKNVGGTGNAVGLRCWTNCLMVVYAATALTGTDEISMDSATSTLATLRAASPRTILDPWYGSRIVQKD